MPRRPEWTWLVLTMLAGPARAEDALDEFANNLFSDLAPLLSLFGERVTMQFMSQALGWADCVVLAMAPLGIITIIVSAIRVGGPPRLKAIIGRARENTSASEMEVMSSTSREVCELYNGESVVRCQGVAPVWEYICLVPRTGKGNLSGRIEFKTLKQALSDGLLLMEGSENPSHQTNNQKTGQTSTAAREDDSILNLSQTTTRESLPRWRHWLRRRNGHPEVSQDISIETGQPSSPHPDKRRIEISQTSAHTSGSQASWTKPQDSHHSSTITVIRSTDPEAPNICMNLSDIHNRTVIRIAAVVGTVLQLSVLIFAGVITYHPSISPNFQKDDDPVSAFAFPLTASGIILLVAGLLLCAHVVESSTHEQVYRPNGDFDIHLYWVQQGQTVGDQIFKSFATFPSAPRSCVITSRRAVGFQKRKGDQVLQLKTVAGVGVALAGFIVQFVGIRAMNAAVSIAQLGAVCAMTVARALVRPGFASSFEKRRLLPGFELDWMAWRLRTYDPASAEGATKRRQNSANSKDKSSQPELDVAPESTERLEEQQHVRLGSWAVVTGGETRYHPFETVINQPSPQRLFDVRRELCKLAGFSNETTTIASNLATAIVKTLGTFFPDGTGTETLTSFVWNVDIAHGGPKSMTESDSKFSLELSYDGASWKVVPECLEAILSLWAYTAADAEARNNSETISLYDDRRARKNTGRPGLRFLGRAAPNQQGAITEDLDRWAPKAFYALQGTWYAESSEDPADPLPGAVKDFDQSRLVGFSQLKRVSGTRKRQFYAVTDPEWKRSVSRRAYWAVETNDSLELLYAKDLLFSFVCSAAESLKKPLRGKVEAEHEVTVVRKKFEYVRDLLRTDGLDGLINTFVQLGFGLEWEATMSVILPLSISDKLPVPLSVFDSFCTKRVQFRLPGEDSDGHHTHRKPTFYSKLTRFSRSPDIQRAFYRHVFCLLVNQIYEAQYELWLMETEGRASSEVNKELAVLQDHRNSLMTDLTDFYKERKDFCSKLEKLYVRLGRPTKVLVILRDAEKHRRDDFSCYFRLRQEDVCLGQMWHMDLRGDRSVDEELPDCFGITAVHLECLKSWWYERPIECIDERDIGGLTLMHYAAAAGNRRLIWMLLQKGADFAIADFHAYTPLHYACGHGHRETAQLLVEWGADLGAIGTDGASPLHLAAANGHVVILNWLKQSDNSFRRLSRKLVVPWGTQDFYGRLAIHWAVVRGQRDVVAMLYDANMDARDRSGWTPLHLAVLHGKYDLVSLLCDELSVDRWVKDKKGRTALHLACERKDLEAARRLLAQAEGDDGLLRMAARCVPEGMMELLCVVFQPQDLSAVINTSDGEGNTLLHTAAESRNLEAFKLFVEKGANLNLRNHKGQTPYETLG